MKQFFLRCCSVSWALVSTGVLLVAIAITAARLLTPVVKEYQQEIEQTLSRVLQRPVSIQQVNARWWQFAPHIHLQGISVERESGEGPSAILIRDAYLKVDWIGSLLNRSPQVKSLVIMGAELGLERRADGSFVLHGIDADYSSNGAWLRGSLIENADIRLELRDSWLEWRDEVSGVETQFSEVNIALKRDGRTYRLAAHIPLPLELGESIDIRAAFKGDAASPASWRGRLYVKGDRLSPGLAVTSFLPGVESAPDGFISMELWSDWRRGVPVRVAGSIAVRNTSIELWRVVPGMEQVPQQFDRFHADGVWKGSPEAWRLQLAGVHAVVGGQPLPGSELGIAYRSDGAGNVSFAGVIDRLGLEEITPILLSHRNISAYLARYVPVQGFYGDLEDVLLVLASRQGALERLGVSATFRDLGVESHGGFPSLRGFDGQLSMDESSGEISLSSEGVQVRLPALMDEVIGVDLMEGVIGWRITDGVLDVSTDLLSVENRDIQVDGRGSLSFAGGPPGVDVELAFRDADIGAVGRYLPHRRMKAGLTRWLRESLIGGRVPAGSLLLRGDMASFPFRDGGGVFEVEALIADGSLAVNPTRMRLDGIDGVLSWRNEGLRVDASSARVLGLDITTARADIPDVGRAVLEFSASGRGGLNDMAALLDLASPARAKRGRRIPLDLEGSGALDLELKLPIARKLRGSIPFTSRGELRFRDAVIGVHGLDLEFDKAGGTLRFGPQGIQGEGLTARLNGRRVRGRAVPEGDSGSRILLSGTFPARDLWAGKGRPSFLGAIKGAAQWNAAVTVPPLPGGGQADIAVELSSDLVGMAVDLPAPLGKTPGQARSLTLRGRFVPDVPPRLRIDYGDISAAVVLDGPPGDRAIERAEFRFSDGAAQLPPRGIRVRGSLREISVDAWYTWWRERGGASSGGRAVPLSGRLQDIDVQVQRLEAMGLTVENLALQGRRQGTDWNLQVESSLLGGRMDIPADLSSGRPLKADLDHLELRRPTREGGSGQGQAGPPPDPAAMPPLKVKSRRLTVAGREFSDAVLETTPITNGMQIHLLRLGTESLTCRITGDWRRRPGGVQATSLRVDVHAGDLGAALKDLRLSDGYEGGTAELGMDIRWPDTPYRPTFHGLRGNARLEARKGRIREIKPGPGRVLGLINPSTLPSRISLDFTDMIKKGFFYDSIEGNFTLLGSDLYTRDLLVKGRSAEVAIIGRTGLAERDYDQLMMVTPQIGLGLPIAGAILGGPIVGVAVFAVERLLKHSGRDISRISRVKYKVTGTWDNPVIRMARPPGVDESVQGELEGID